MTSSAASHRLSNGNRILIYLTHPAHVHFFRHAIEELRSNGYLVEVYATDKDITLDLADELNIDHHVIDLPSIFNPFDIRSQLNLDYELYRASLEFKPDIITSVGGTAAAHVSKLTDSNSVVFYDTEHATLQNWITYPFSDVIITPDCYEDDLGDNQIRYPGYHELAYLHPNRFEPDPSVLDEAGLSTDDSFVILRMVDWQALHDIGDSGFDDVVDVVTQLKATGAEVLITAEGDIPDAVSHCHLDIEPHRIHDLMAYADLFIGESATMASESAVLGTPAVFVSSSRRGYTDELEERYGLAYNFSGDDRHQAGLKKAVELLEDDDTKKWKNRRKRLLEDKIDTTEFIIEQTEKIAN